MNTIYINLSMDGKGRAIDNAFIERLWRSVKYEKLYLYPPGDGTDLYLSLAEYFNHYNMERRYRGTDGQIPGQLYFQLKKEYDDYGFISSTGWNVENTTWPTQTCDCEPGVKGQVTGTKIKTLVTDANTWLNSTTHYDDRYRVKQVFAENNTGDIDEFTNTHNFNRTINVTPGGSYSAGLNTVNPTGPGISIAAGPGDQVDLSVLAYYEDNSAESNRTGITGLASLIAGSIAAAPGVITEGGLDLTISDEIAGTAFLGGSTINGSSPAAFLNWMVFDENYQLIAAKTGFKRVESDKSVSDPPHELIHHIDFDQVGYLFVYVSNETADPAVFVHFDELKVTHTESAVVQAQSYYPFGLSFNGYQRVGNQKNRFKSNSKEFQTDLDLDLYDYGLRQYDPAIARFTSLQGLLLSIH